MTEKQLRDGIRAIKADPRWQLKYCERFGDAFHPFTDGIQNGIRGIGYIFPWSRTVKGKEINRSTDEGWCLIVCINGCSQTVKIGIGRDAPQEYADIAEAIEQAFEIEDSKPAQNPCFLAMKICGLFDRSEKEIIEDYGMLGLDHINRVKKIFGIY